MSSMLYEIAGLFFAFHADCELVLRGIRHTLRHHIARDSSGLRPTAAVLRLVSLPDGIWYVCRRRLKQQGERWEWDIHKGSPEWSWERFYYRVLFRIMGDMLAKANVVRLHGALLYDEQVGAVLALGDRGAGKSSLAAGWLESGGLLTTDDTVLLRQSGSGLKAFGIHRELHVDPQLSHRLPGLVGLPGSPEYLPGSNRLAFDWVRYFPGRLVSCPPWPAHVLRSRVTTGATTSISPLSRSELSALVEDAVQAESSNRDVAESVAAGAKNRLEACAGWDVTWGPDIWEQPGKHLGWLRAAIGSCRSRA